MLTAVIAGVVAFHQLDSREASVKSTGKVFMDAEQGRDLVTDAINGVIKTAKGKDNVTLDNNAILENMLCHLEKSKDKSAPQKK